MTIAPVPTPTPSNGGGGGSAPSSDPKPTPSAPTVVTPSTPQPLSPSDPAPVATLGPGESYVTIGGAPTPVTTTPNAPAGTSATSGDGWSLTQGGRTPADKPQPLRDEVIQIPQGGTIVVSGSGYAPGTTVVVYAMNPALQLGAVTVGADGSFRARLPVT